MNLGVDVSHKTGSLYYFVLNIMIHIEINECFMGHGYLDIYRRITNKQDHTISNKINAVHKWDVYCRV